MKMWSKVMGKENKMRALALGILTLSALALTACGGKKAEQASSFTVGFD